jgi:hypothetical protein
VTTLALPGLFTSLDLRGITANNQKLPIVCRWIEPFLSLDHRGQEFRRTRLSFKLFSHDHRSFRVNQWLTLRKDGSGDVIQVDRPKHGLMKVVLLVVFGPRLFTDITDVNNNSASTRECRPINGHDNWLHVRFAPGTVRRDPLQRCGLF